MANRFLKPTAPYTSPEAFLAANLPLAEVAYDPENPSTETVDKDVQFVNVCSKSTFNVPTGYHNPDACGNEFYTKANVASNIKNTKECGLTDVFIGSLSVTVPRDISESEFKVFTDALVAALYLKIAEVA